MTNSKRLDEASLNDLKRERLELLIKLNEGPRRRKLLRIKSTKQVQSDLLIVNKAEDDGDDLTLYLMETVVQMSSIKITDAIKNTTPLIFNHDTDWTIFNDRLDELSNTVSLSSIRDCINQWVLNAKRANRCPDETSTKLLFSYPSDMNTLREVVEWLDELQCQ